MVPEFIWTYPWTDPEDCHGTVTTLYEAADIHTGFHCGAGCGICPQQYDGSFGKDGLEAGTQRYSDNRCRLAGTKRQAGLLG